MKAIDPNNDPSSFYWSQGNNYLLLKALQQKIKWKCRIWCIVFGLAECIKRSLDIIGSLVGLILFSPIFLCASLAIFFEDKGPVFFKQIRIGKQGRLFYILKFRSMKMNAESEKIHLEHLNQHKVGVTFKIQNDPRITKIGRFLRKTSLDEVPQFLNVLKGEMSLVGPRPPVPKEVAQYKAAQLRRLMVKPGITGLWQVSGRANIDFEGQVRLDLQYIHSESIWQDIKILLLTLPAVLLGKGAY